MSEWLNHLLNKPGGLSPGEADEAMARAELRVLMVCMGNICRSPTAEVVLRHRLQQAGLGERVAVDSAGTHAWHVGRPPDERSQAAALRRGHAMAHLRARQVQPLDAERFDLLLAMDWDNLALLEPLCPPERRHRLRKLTDHIPVSHPLAGAQTVPDPYHGGPEGFEAVLDLIEASCDGLVPLLRAALARRDAER
jgi:protein-tyrosine phosphatase